jgi:hypothetical protein
MTTEEKLLGKNNHPPDEQLLKYMKEKSHFSRRKQQLELRRKDERKEGKKLTDEQKKEIQEELEGIEGKLRTLKNTKTKVLDEIIFPSMANLTFFFDAISKDPELERTFNSDISQLLGIRRLHPRPWNYAFVFVKLIHGMISTTDDYKQNDFRIRLIHELQKLIRTKFQTLSLTTFPIGQFSAFKIVNQDIDRVLAWMEMISSKINDEYDFENMLNPESIPSEYLQNEEIKREYKDKRNREKLEKFDSMQLKPKRTIDFPRFTSS